MDLLAKLEQQAIVRLPPALAARVHNALGGEEPIDIKLFFPENSRRGKVAINGESYHATLVDMPSYLETFKTFDSETYFKSADIGQVVVVQEGPENTHPVRATSGITPPAARVTKLRPPGPKPIRKLTDDDLVALDKKLAELSKSQNKQDTVTVEILDEEDAAALLRDPSVTVIDKVFEEHGTLDEADDEVQPAVHRDLNLDNAELARHKPDMDDVEIEDADGDALMSPPTGGTDFRSPPTVDGYVSRPMSTEPPTPVDGASNKVKLKVKPPPRDDGRGVSFMLPPDTPVAPGGNGVGVGAPPPQFGEPAPRPPEPKAQGSIDEGGADLMAVDNPAPVQDVPMEDAPPLDVPTGAGTVDAAPASFGAVPPSNDIAQPSFVAAAEVGAAPAVAPVVPPVAPVVPAVAPVVPAVAPVIPAVAPVIPAVVPVVDPVVPAVVPVAPSPAPVAPAPAPVPPAPAAPVVVPPPAAPAPNPERERQIRELDAQIQRAEQQAREAEAQAKSMPNPIMARRHKQRADERLQQAAELRAQREAL